MRKLRIKTRLRALSRRFPKLLTGLEIALPGSRLRELRAELRRVQFQNQALIDRNWELKEAEQHTRNLYESQSDLIVIRDSEARITFANDAFVALSKRTRDELIGSDFVLDVLVQGETAAEPGGARIHDQQISTELRPRWIAWRESLIRSHSGEATELVAVGRDVTDRTETERALGNARDAANEANRAKSRFLAVASHEIRTPLNGIIGMSALLLDTSLTAEQATYAKAVKTSGDALLSLIEELLDFSKIEAGKIDLDCRAFNLAGLIEEIVELIAPRAQARELEIAAFVDERLPAEVMGDASRLRQVLLNLAGNAIKFTSTGGVALIVEPGIWPNEISFQVRDTGIGIAPEAQARIFREFEQADERISRNYGGTGLGLSISDRIVRRMGGRIAIDSASGQGSTFDVSIPLRAAANSKNDSFIAPDLSGQSIMLVAQGSIEASLIARRLERWGAQTCVTSDLAVARALLPERLWSAVLIDRDIGAIESVRLSEDALHHATHRVVMLTPAARHAVAATGLAAFTGYLVKPLRAASLAARLGPMHTSLVPDMPGDDDSAPVAPIQPLDRGLSILVAEDNEINALLMRSLLTRMGHRAVIAIDGHQAVESWVAAETAGAPYDLVFMDVQMPELDGIAATRQIRARETSRVMRRTPIIALTANSLLEDRDACFAAGMDSFLVKPLDRDKLTEVLKSIAPFEPVTA